jgi:predicted RND superfamily exporter protein
MPVDPTIRKNWIEIQKKFEVPVNAIGVKIDQKDVNTLKVWKEEGIDRFLKK